MIPVALTRPLRWARPGPIVLGLLLAAPLLYFLTRLATHQTADLLPLLLRPRLWELVLNTLWLVLGVVVADTALAFPLAYLLARRRFVARSIAHALVTLPLAIPGYVLAWSLLGLTGEQGLLRTWFDLAVPQPRGLLGATLTIALYTFPMLVWNLYQGFRELDPALEQAASTLGKSRLERFWRVILPQILPAFQSGGALVALYVSSDFAVPLLLGYEVLASAIYTEIVTSYARAGAFLLTTVSLTLTALLLLVCRPHRTPTLRVGFADQTRTLRPLPAWSAWAVFALLLFPVICLLALPLAGWLSQPRTWESFVAYNRFVPAIVGTLRFSLLGALLGTSVAVAAAWLSRGRPTLTGRLPVNVLHLLYSLPGTALAFSWVLFYLHALHPLYQTEAGYVLAVGLLAAALALGPIEASFGALSPLWVAAARSLGKGPWDIALRIVWPGIRSGIGTGFFLSLGWILRELPLAALLSPLGSRTLPLAIFGHTVEADYAGAAPYVLALLALGLGIGGIAALWRTRHDLTL